MKVCNSSVQEDEVEKIILVRGGKGRVLWKGARSHRPSRGGAARFQAEFSRVDDGVRKFSCFWVNLEMG